MTMRRTLSADSILSLRLPRSLDSSLERAARRKRTSKSALVRELLVAGLATGEKGDDLAEEARRQSLRASRHRSERETLEFVAAVADRRGWE